MPTCSTIHSVGGAIDCDDWKILRDIQRINDEIIERAQYRPFHMKAIITQSYAEFDTISEIIYRFCNNNNNPPEKKERKKQ